MRQIIIHKADDDETGFWAECPSLGVVSQALQNAGFVVAREKRLLIMHRKEPSPMRTVPIPKHTTIKKGTLRGIIRQAGLTVDEFIDLLK